MKLFFLSLTMLLLAGQAFAACPVPLPFTLLNGTIADAGQVMANFNNVWNCGFNPASVAITGGSITNNTLISPLNVKGASGNVVAGIFSGYGTPSSLTPGGMWLQFQGNSQNRATILDDREVNSAGSIIDQAFVTNFGLQYWDAGVEQADIDFGGYRNGVLDPVWAALSAGCTFPTNTAANNAASIACPSGGVSPNFSPGTNNLFDLGSGTAGWKHLFLSQGVIIDGSTNPGTGVVGELLTSAAVSCLAPVGLTNNTAATIVSINLSVGVWDITGTAGFTGATTTVVNSVQGSISATTNTMNNTIGNRVVTVTSGGTPFLYDRIESTLPIVRVQAGSPTTYYLVEFATFATSTLSGCGQLRAVRVA